MEKKKAHQDLKKLALRTGYIIRCMENEYGNATSVVFPYLEVRQTERIGDQLHQESQELAKLHEGCL